MCIACIDATVTSTWMAGYILVTVALIHAATQSGDLNKETTSINKRWTWMKSPIFVSRSVNILSWSSANCWSRQNLAQAIENLSPRSPENWHRYETTQISVLNLPSTIHHNRFTALFPRPPGWAGARRELLDFMVQGKINRGRHTDHPAGRHSIRTNQCPPPPSVRY